MIGADNSRGIKDNQQKQLEQAFHAGVPTELRKYIWSLVVPNNLKITEKLYTVLLKRAKICTENAEKDSQFRKNLKVIEEDLHRTYSEMNVFRYGNDLY